MSTSVTESGLKGQADSSQKNAGAQLSPEEKAAKRAKAEQIGRYVAMFLMPLIMVGMLVSGYLAAMHSPTPHNMPVIVAGDAIHAQRVATTLEQETGNALKATVLTSADKAITQVKDREVAGAIVLNESSATLYSAAGAGASQQSSLMKLALPQLMAEGYAVDTQDVAPLPKNDVAGLAAVFMTTALLMAGYLPFSVMLSNSPELLRFRRVVPLLAGWAALVSGLIAVITGPVLGLVSGHTLPVLGLSWLAIFAIGSVQLFFTRLMGPLAVIIAMLLLMVLGVPASGLSVPLSSLNGFYSFLHAFLPAPAIGESLRSILYFGGSGVWPHVAVLATGAVAGLGLTALFDARKKAKTGQLVDPPVLMASLHGGKRPKNAGWRYGALFAFCISMVAMMVTVMLGAMGKPMPRDMPVAVVGATMEQSQQAAAGLGEAMPGFFDLKPVGSAEEAHRMVIDRDVVAAYVLPSQDNPAATLMTSQAANVSGAQIANSMFTQVAAGQQVQLNVQELTPLPQRDSMGMTSMYLAMGWIMSGFMIVVVGANAMPASKPLRKMIPIVAGWAVGISAILYLIAGPIIGALHGNFFALWGAGALTVFCVAWFAAIFERLIGMLATPVVVGLLMFLGIPASNAAVSLYMVPDFFRHLHDILPFPAAAETIKSILYFDGSGAGSHLITLTIIGVVSLAIVAVLDRVKPLRIAPVGPLGSETSTQICDDPAASDDSTGLDDDLVLAGV